METMLNTNRNNDLSKSVRDRLLDVAEELFAEKGFNSTSIREITAKSHSNIAAVNYHFGGKENLYSEVFRRRLIALRDIRLARIEKVMSQPTQKPTLKDLIQAFANAFIEPLIDQSSGRRFMKLMINEMSDPHLPKKMFADEIAGPTLNALGKGIAMVCPGLEQKKIMLSIISIIGQLLQAVHINEMLNLSDIIGAPAPTLPEMVDHIVDFSVAGIQAAITEKK